MFALGFLSVFDRLLLLTISSLATRLASALTGSCLKGEAIIIEHTRRVNLKYYVSLFGCEVAYMLQDTKGLSHGKWEGTGEAGVLAGYGLNSGYRWNGEYLCWSLRAPACIEMHEHAPNFPFSLSSPHRTRRALLPRSGEPHFPLKEKYDKQTRSMEGLFDAECDKEQKKAQSMDIVGIFN